MHESHWLFTFVPYGYFLFVNDNMLFADPMHQKYMKADSLYELK